MGYGILAADQITTSVTGVSLGAGNATRFKNKLINSDMRIDQRNSGASTTITATAYTLDRWQAYCAGVASKFSVQQNSGAVTPPVGFTNYLGAVSLSAYSVSSTDRFGINQTIEGLNASDLGWGTADAKTVTLSFWVRSSLTGTFGGSIQNYGATRSYPFSYTISSANTWTQISVTVAGDTTGTWLTTNSGFATLNFALGTGATYSGTAGAWATADYRSTTGATSVVGTSGATFYITGVQLEVGESATGFEYVDYGTQLAMCNRYFYQGVLSGSGAVGSSTICYAYVKFPQLMRTTPTIAWISGGRFGNGSGDGAITALNSSIGGTTGDAVVNMACSFGSATQGAVMYNSPIFSLAAEL